MDDNPFEIPPLMSSTRHAKGQIDRGKENINDPAVSMDPIGSDGSNSFSTLPRNIKRPRPGQNGMLSNKSPKLNGQFYSSQASPNLGPSPGVVTTSRLGSGSKLLSSKNRPLRSLKEVLVAKQHPSSPKTRLSPPLSSFSSVVPNLPNSSSKNSNTNTRQEKDSVLRVGETMDGFFCISHCSSDEYIRLVESVVNGSRANDPPTWRRILEHATQQQEVSGGNPLYMVRIHRRATLRFRLEPQELAQMSKEKERQDVFAMWVSNARTYAMSGNIIEARKTYCHIDHKIPHLRDVFRKNDENSKLISSFYLSFAAFEFEQCHDKNAAEEILLRGIKASTDPSKSLTNYLHGLSGERKHDAHEAADFKTSENYRLKTLRSPRSSNKGVHQSPAQKPKFTSSLLQKPADAKLSLKESVDDVFPKERTTNCGSSRSPKHLKPRGSSPVANATLIESTVDSLQLQKLSPKSSFSRNNNSSRSPNKYPGQHNPTAILQLPPSTVVVTSTDTGVTGKPPTASSKKRSSLTSRLGRVGLSGAPKRIESDQTATFQHGEKTDENDQESDCGEDTKVPSFKNMDLSYIWTWKPKESVNNGQSDGGIIGGQPTQGSGDSSNDSGAASKIKENDELEKKEKKAMKQKQLNQQSIHIPSALDDVKTQDASQSGVNGSSNQEEEVLSPATRKKRLLDEANLDFLPLVHNDNILRVNKHSYVKLGAIGKGGSCKVYRALSKRCSVVAIKKVKLDGKDKKQIEGYANEISLLKRLRGNPSIIQIYDSELDHRRRSLFVVMELGEVDLNYVLAQRRKAKTSKSLDMNFIRLTWQQMLSAVYAIHQENIIHSDLKPANFLFVRGALKLIDFGIAKAIVNPEDTTKIIRESQIGTLNYMSPESIVDTGEGNGAGPRMKIGRASDVWSLGIILYEMLYGITPFAQYHFIVKLQAIINENHKIPFPFAGDSAEAAIDAIKHCLLRCPDDRPPIVGEKGLLNEHWFLHSARCTIEK